MNRMQEKMLDMMRWYHAFCVENGLQYFVVGGTALGAIRHKGFIPWDDDIDVAMPRPDYERFRELTSNMTDERYTAEFPGKKDFVYPYGKIYDKTTTLVENTRYQTKRGIFIDVFPLDGLADSKDEAVSRFKRIDNKVKLLTTLVCAWRKERKLYKNLALFMGRLLPPFILSSGKLIRQIDAWGKSVSYDACDYVANTVGNWHQKEIMKREWFGEPTLYDFEGIRVFGPQDSHSYLTQLYGDYMKLPPVEKQVSHHDYVMLDLERSYQA